MTGTPNPDTVSTRLQRIAKLAREMPGVALRTLAQYIDIDFLREAYRRTRKDGAVGVDRQTAEQYAEDLESNLQSLLDRAKSGTYRAPPVQRGAITKAGNRRARRILVQAAWGLLRTRGPKAAALRDWARQLAARRGKNVAVVGLARRIAGILYALWRDGTTYEVTRVRGVRRSSQADA